MRGPSPKNFVYFVRNNPPAALILLFLLFMIVTTLGLAFNAKKNNLLDTDILMDTYQLKTFINDLRVCIKPNDNNSNNAKVIKRETNENDQITISALVHIKDIDILNTNIKHVYGLINLKGFQPSCSNNKGAEYLEVGFDLKDKSDENKICIQLTGKRKILENFLPTPCESHFVYQPSAAILQTKEPNSFGSFCNNGTKINFEFDRKENTMDFSLYLKQEKLARVSKSLVWFSYGLIALLLVLILVVLFFYDEPQANDFYF